MQLGNCCEGCAKGGACEGATMGNLSYDATPFDAYNNAQQPMAWNKYPAGDEFVYSDSLGRGGATQLRYAETAQGSSALPGMPETGSGGEWRRQLGDLGQPQNDEPPIPTLPHPPPCGPNEQEVFGQCFPVVPGQLPPGTTPPVGVLTEQQCAQREQLAFDKGRAEERTHIVTTAAITAVVSGLVGVGIGYVFRR